MIIFPRLNAYRTSMSWRAMFIFVATFSSSCCVLYAGGILWDGDHRVLGLIGMTVGAIVLVSGIWLYFQESTFHCPQCRKRTFSFTNTTKEHQRLPFFTLNPFKQASALAEWKCASCGHSEWKETIGHTVVPPSVP